MTIQKYIWIKGQRYYLYKTYDTWEQAKKEAQYHRKRNKSRHFIIEFEHGFFMPTQRYALYLNKCIALW